MDLIQFIFSPNQSFDFHSHCSHYLKFYIFRIHAYNEKRTSTYTSLGSEQSPLWHAEMSEILRLICYFLFPARQNCFVIFAKLKSQMQNWFGNTFCIYGQPWHSITMIFIAAIDWRCHYDKNEKVQVYKRIWIWTKSMTMEFCLVYVTNIHIEPTTTPTAYGTFTWSTMSSSSSCTSNYPLLNSAKGICLDSSPTSN